jgi:hexokinase
MPCLCDFAGPLQMRAGLAEDGGSTLPMIPTLVDILPDGHEHGKFFSIDLGGTNLRCAYVKLPRDHAEVVSSLESL